MEKWKTVGNIHTSYTLSYSLSQFCFITDLCSCPNRNTSIKFHHGMSGHLHVCFACILRLLGDLRVCWVQLHHRSGADAYKHTQITPKRKNTSGPQLKKGCEICPPTFLKAIIFLGFMLMTFFSHLKLPGESTLDHLGSLPGLV